jgi:hypothetical protein
VGYTIIVKKSPREQAQQAQALVGRNRLSAVVRTAAEARDLAHTLGGRDMKPRRPVMVDTGHSRVLVVGDGDASAAELSDLAVSAIEKQEGQRKRTGTDVDFDSMRERANLMRREEVDPAIRQALRERAAKHLANPVSDPARAPQSAPNVRYRKTYGGK